MYLLNIILKNFAPSPPKKKDEILDPPLYFNYTYINIKLIAYDGIIRRLLTQII